MLPTASALYLLLRWLYICPVLFGLMLLHIFLILLVLTDCTGWYSFSSCFINCIPYSFSLYSSMIYSLLYGSSCNFWLVLCPISFSLRMFRMSPTTTADVFFSAVFCNPSGHFMKIILHCILLFPVKPLDMFR